MSKMDMFFRHLHAIVAENLTDNTELGLGYDDAIIDCLNWLRQLYPRKYNGENLGRMLEDPNAEEDILTGGMYDKR